jgi:Protein of unknown function (DUF2630)
MGDNCGCGSRALRSSCEEHRLFERSHLTRGRQPPPRAVQVELDLLRQRRALREFGGDPSPDAAT